MLGGLGRRETPRTPFPQAFLSCLARSVLPLAPFVVFLLWAALPLQAQAGQDLVLIGEDADNYYYMERSKFKGSAAERLGAQYRRAKLEIAADQTAIRELGFALDVDSFQRFEELAKKEKEELQHQIFDALLEQGLEATRLAAESAKSLNPWNVQKAIHFLEEKGFRNGAVFAALRKIAATKGKPEMAAAYKEFAESLKAAKIGWDTGRDAAKDPDHAELRMAVGVLKVLQGNPELGLAVTAAEFGEHLVALGYMSGKVKELTALTDEKLTRLATLTERLHGHVKELNESRTAWRKATGHQNASPILDP